MAIRVKARYEDNVLKPLGELELKEGEEVEISIVPKGEILSISKLKDTKTRSSKGYWGKLRLSSKDLEEIYLSGILRRYETERV